MSHKIIVKSFVLLTYNKLIHISFLLCETFHLADTLCAIDCALCIFIRHCTFNIYKLTDNNVFYVKKKRNDNRNASNNKFMLAKNE